MRIDLETIKKIEAYLTGTMNPEDVKTFEQEIANKPELKNAVEQQKNLMKAMENIYVKRAAVKAGQKVRMYKLIKISGIVVLSVGVLLTIFLLAFNGSDKTFNGPQDKNRGESQTSSVEVGDLLPSQKFTIDPSHDTTLTCSKGTKIFIPDSSFIDANGVIITGPIELEVKECLDKFDMVVGNMATLTNGSILESGGMIYINATSDGEQLSIADNKELTVEVPTASNLAGMQLFEGDLGDGTVNWVNPRSLTDDLAMVDSLPVGMATTESKTQMVDTGGIIFSDKNAFTWSLISHMNSVHYNDSVKKITPIVLDYMREGIVDNFIRDTTVTLKGMQVRFYIKFNVFNGWNNQDNDNNNGDNVVTFSQNRGNNNNFLEDQAAKYVYTTKKLGWANIDRLMNDPRTKPVDLIVEVSSNGEFDDVTTSMVFDYRDIYLPGYQKMDGKFSYSHGDYEKMKLPIGEKATLIAIGYKNGKPFLSIQKVTIMEAQNVILKLNPVTPDELRNQLLSNL